MKQLIYFSSIDIFRNPIIPENLDTIPGGKLFSMLFHIVGGNYVFYDRSRSITIPLKYKLLPHLEIPTYVQTNKSFVDICDDRAHELMERAISNNRKIGVMYSGGIDSTLVLSSLMKNYSKDMVKKNVSVLMTEHSIAENPNFYYDFISPSGIECIPSLKYADYLGSKEYMIINGEQSDQLYLPNFALEYFKGGKFDLLYASPTADVLVKFIDDFLPAYKEKDSAEKIYQIWRKICDGAPFEITNVSMFLWWVIFATKWQSCYFRMVPFCNKLDTLELETGYTPFFCNDEFQLWSMNSMQNLNIDNLLDMKMESKRYIYDFNKDEQYLKEKDKVGSLYNAVKRKRPAMMIDEDMNVYNKYPTQEFINYQNDFVL